MKMNDLPTGALSPAEAARRTLKLLAERRQTPTPESFAEAYQEVTGRRNGAAALVIKEVLRDFVRSGRVSSQEAAQALQRARDNDWRAVQESMAEAIERRAGTVGSHWPSITLALLKLADGLHPNWTRARKLDAVTRVIDASGDQPDVALERLSKLIESWGPALATARPPEPAAEPPAPAALPAAPRPAVRPIDTAAEDASKNARAAAEAWQQVAQRALRLLEKSCGDGVPAVAKLREFETQHAQLAPDEVGKLVPRFTDVVASVERRLEEQNKIKAGLARMLALLCDNMRSLTPEETWLAGQLEPIRALLGGPLSADDLSIAEHSLAMVIERQVNARRSLQDAKVALKEMLATLIERIGTMGDSTGKFYQQVGDYQSKLEGAADFETLSTVIRGLLTDTKAMRADIQSSHDELLAARRKVESYETRVRELERELSQVAVLVQRDPLTHAMNRRGLDEAFKVEVSRAQRYGSDMSFLMIDVDNFKKVNDSLGHLGGDRALVHLAQTLHATLRPTDVLVRLGGEEFGVLLPSTSLADAKTVGERLQRELARRTFQFENQPCPLTFSGGLAQWHSGELLEQWIERADSAMYRAKRAGKNRIELAE